MWKDEKGQPSKDLETVSQSERITHTKSGKSLACSSQYGWKQWIKKKKMKRHKATDGLHTQVQGLESTHGKIEQQTNGNLDLMKIRTWRIMEQNLVTDCNKLMTYIPCSSLCSWRSWKKTICKGKTKFIIHKLVIVYLVAYPGTLSILFRNIWDDGLTSIIFYYDIGCII